MSTAGKIIKAFMHGSMPQRAQDGFGAWYIDKENAEEKEQALYEEWEALCSHGVRDSCTPAERRRKLSSLHRKMGVQATTRSRKGIFLNWYLVAACLCAVAAISGTCYWALDNSKARVTTCLVATASSKGSFTLPDGSHVWLNSGSRLEYDGNLSGGRTRTVRLDGEGFFDVVKASAPFVVEMGEMSVKVLGTSFNARNSKSFPENQVTLSEGRVKISCNGREICLLPGQQCSYDTGTGSLSVRNVDVSNYSSWTGSGIVFDNMTLADIATNLEHWYNMSVRFGPGVDASVRLSFKLRHEAVGETMNILEHLTRYRCSEDGQGILISTDNINR